MIDEPIESPRCYALVFGPAHKTIQRRNPHRSLLVWSQEFGGFGVRGLWSSGALEFGGSGVCEALGASRSPESSCPQDQQYLGGQQRTKTKDRGRVSREVSRKTRSFGRVTAATRHSWRASSHSQLARVSPADSQQRSLRNSTGRLPPISALQMTVE